MSWIPPLLVAIPLLTAAVTAGLDHVTPRPLQHALVVAASAATTVLAFVLLWHAESHEVVHWFGGWEPRHGSRSGSTSPSARSPPGCARVIGLVVTLALVYSLTFMRESARLFDALMLARARRDVRVRHVGRPLQPLRLARADGCRRLRAHRVPG